MSDWNPKSGGSSFTKKNYFSLKDGPIVARILPQPKKNPNDPNEQYSDQWNKYNPVVFGYKNSQGKMRSFRSPLVKNRKTKMVEVPCAATQRIETLTMKLNEAKLQGNDLAVAELNKLVGFKGVYSIDKNFHMNVILLDGTIGELKIRGKAFEALKNEIDKLEKGTPDKAPVYPLSGKDGRFFVFTRSGTGLNTTFSVTVHKETVDVPGMGKMERDMVHVLTPAIEERLQKEGLNLNDSIQIVTPEEVAQIVAESDIKTGKSSAVDRILDSRWAKKNGTPIANSATSTTTTNTTTNFGSTTDATKAAAAPTQTANAVAPTQTQTTAPAATAAPSNQPETSSASAPSEEQSDEDFFRDIGVDLTA